MRTLSINRTVDLSNFNFEARTQKGREWVGPLYIKACYGDIPFLESPDYYAIGVARNSKLKEASSRECPIISEEELENGYKGVVVERFASGRVEPAYLSLEIEDEFEKGIEEFRGLRDLVFRETQVDIAVTLLEAYRGMTPAVSMLTKLSQDYAHLYELFRTLLKAPNWRSALEGLVANEPALSPEWA